MSNRNNRIGSDHNKGPRSILRVIGPLFIAVGAIFMIVGFIDFFSAFGSFGRGPHLFWCFFVGMPFLAVGTAMSKFAYMGSVIRYMSNEVSPVAKDTFNYMADGTKDAMGDVAKSIGKGISQGLAQGIAPETEVKCHNCGEENDVDARFCKECGTPIAKSKQCGNCGELNDPDAKFCDNCGKAC